MPRLQFFADADEELLRLMSGWKARPTFFADADEEQFRLTSGSKAARKPDLPYVVSVGDRDGQALWHAHQECAAAGCSAVDKAAPDANDEGTEAE